MKKDTPSFEDFIKGKLAESDFAFEEQHWASAHQRIAELKAADKKRKRRMAAWVFLSLLLLGVSSYGIWKMVSLGDIRQTEQPAAVAGGAVGQPADAISKKEDIETAQAENEACAAQSAIPTTAQTWDAPPKIGTKVIGGNAIPKSVNAPFNQNDGTVTGTDENASETNSEVLDKSMGQQTTIPGISKKTTETLENVVIERRLTAPDLLPHSALANIFTKKKDALTGKLMDLKTKRPSHWGFAASLHFSTGTPFSPTLQELRSSEANLHVSYQMGKKWQAEAGVGYTFMYGNVPVGGREQTTYSFVATTTRYEWGLKNMHFLHLPLELSFRPAARHEISLGGHAFYRIKTAGDLTVYRSTTLEDDTPVLSEKDKDYGAALPLWNFQTSLGYGYRFNQKFTVGVQYRHGLTDLLDDAFFRKTAVDRAAFVGLFLKYKL